MLWLPLAGPISLRATPITEVRSLPREQADRGIAVKVRGTITWRGPSGDFALQDATGGTWSQVEVARERGIWRGDDALVARLVPGSVVEVEGITTGAAYAPAILPRTIRLLGEQPLPAARPVEPARFLAGSEAGSRIEASGTVLGVEPTEFGWELRIQAETYSFWATVPRSALADAPEALDARVRVRGVGGTEYNSRGEFLSAGVMVALPQDLVIERRGANSLFAVPRVSLDMLRAFHSELQPPHRVGIEGTVVYAQPGRFLYLQEGDRAVRVETRSTAVLRPGDRVEAVGFVDMTRQIAGLGGADVRRIGSASPPPPVEIAPEAVLAIDENAKRTGQAAKRDYDGILIQFDARLLAVQAPHVPSESLRQLVLKRGDSVFTAAISSGSMAPLDLLRPDSEVRVWAVVQLEYVRASAPRNQLPPAAVSLLLRSPSDVLVLHAPSWWTVRRLFAAVAIVIAALIATLGWVWELRRQVRRQTARLAEEIHARRNTAIEFQAALRERNRLAANLHDTLLQSMNGIGFQLDACGAEVAGRSPEMKPLTHLEVARQMVVQAVRELRDSVWTLRTLPLGGVGLREALLGIAQRLKAERNVRIEVSIEGDLSGIPDFVAGNLILAAQEALHNALRHANAQKITVVARRKTAPNQIEISICDDGVGFEPGTEPKMTEGHFGLTGIRERLKTLDGSVAIESAPLRGTAVRLRVPLRAYDAKVV
ncbi:MAG TPA: sensor histidine kinase [Opitutaceae bacterium]|nr:sensor histidine kinase [Opitutaceae bacterium]